MNLAAEQQPPQPPQAHRPSTSCDRHPDEQFTGFCPSCLCERLALLDPSSSASSSSRKPPITSSTAAAALKAIFRPSSSSVTGVAVGGGPNNPNRNRPSSFFPELRRTKSFSASKNEGFSGVFEPQRKSCDVRGRNTLWSLFNQDDERNPYKKEAPRASAGPEIEVQTTRNLASSSTVRVPVFESKEEDETEQEEDEEIEAFEEPNAGSVIEDRVEEIVEEEEDEEEEKEAKPEPEPEPEPEPVEDLKTMKDHIDLDSQTKKPSGRDFKEIAGSFWSAASVFSKKLQKWRQKQKLKKRNNGGGSATLPVEKPISRHFRETQSEIADYGFGRRSCDTDPRFSLDIGRMSFDDPRYSFDEPRASWDGHLISTSRTFQRMPTMLSVVEDAPVHVLRSDAHIPVEDPRSSFTEYDDDAPGGSAQTRDYYLDSSSRRRKSLDRSSSIRKTAAAVVAEIDELKSVVSNAKVTPATGDFYPGHGPKLVGPDRESRDSNSISLRDDCCSEGAFEVNLRDNLAHVVGNSNSNGIQKGPKKVRRWGKGWSIWGFIHRRNGNKEEDEDRYSRANGVVERSFSGSWQELRTERNSEVRAGMNPKAWRSNSSVSWRNSQNIGVGVGGGGGSFGSMRKTSTASTETNGLGNGRKKRDEFVLERNSSARYSPNNNTTNHIDNGLLRFYLTPMRGSGRRSWSGAKTKPNPPPSIARSVMRLY